MGPFKLWSYFRRAKEVLYTLFQTKENKQNYKQTNKENTKLEHNPDVIVLYAEICQAGRSIFSIHDRRKLEKFLRSTYFLW